MGALFTIAVGAVLTYAVHFTVVGINIHIVGIIVMLAGVAALLAIIVRAAGDARRHSRSEERQDELVHARVRPTSRVERSARVYGQVPPQTYAPPMPAVGTADPYMLPEQRANVAPGTIPPTQIMEPRRQ